MSASVVVDLRARFIDERRKVFILFPGNGYRYYDLMNQNSIVFLDIAGFPYSEGEDIAGAIDLPRRITLSDRVRDWHRRGRPEDEIPVRDTRNLGRVRITNAKIQLAGLVRGFLSTIKPGDIIIVPAPTYEQDMLYGEVQGPAFNAYDILSEFPRESVPALPVEWVQKMPRSMVPLWLERKIPSPNPLRQIEKVYFPSVFDIMFERYFYNGKFCCKFDVKSKEFSALDDFLFQQIVLYTSALHENLNENNIDVSTNSISVIASQIEYSEDIPELKMNINSPGHIVVLSDNIIPLVTGVLIALAAATNAAGDTAMPSVKIVNSADQGPFALECVADVQAEAMQDLRAMGYPRWQELCMIEQQARKRTGLSSGMDTSPDPLVSGSISPPARPKDLR